MGEARDVPIKIRRISIKNYKGVDSLDLEIPAPLMLDDPDILVMGSKNGLGKTSVIECCALLLLAHTIPEKRIRLNDRYSAIDVPDLLIKAGSDYAEIEGEVVFETDAATLQMRIDRRGNVRIYGESLSESLIDSGRFDLERDSDQIVKAICGFSPNPVIDSLFLLFHSYRKIQEGNPELGMMVQDRARRRSHRYDMRTEFPVSAFKVRILRSLMAQADLFELEEESESREANEKLNELVELYVGGTIGKLRSSSDNTVDLRISLGNGEKSFTFDGLSSGQKEIISTLFLIWYHTKNKPSVVFIDEPELHLNAQWHRSFADSLLSLAPQNQYIIATHSEDVMGSVDEDRRILLSDDYGPGE
ncbi:MAG: AAA family ATPase [Gemmatimonadota bacterium]|nr:AAA family ATPase [Gemmatimonadota bacterium]